MNSIILSLVALVSAAAALAAGPAVDFDSGVDASALLGQARAEASVRSASSYRPDGRSYDFECREIIFTATSPQGLSAGLESHDLVSDCPNGNYNNRGDCASRRGSLTRYASAAVTVRGRKPLLPWESDTFRVCMEGTKVDMTPLDTAYEYSVVQQGTEQNGWEFAVEPGAKRAIKADPDGITARFASGIKVEFTDKWASYYAGQTVEIKYALKTEKNSWFDGTAAEGVIRAAAAPSYSWSLANLRLKAGPKYYVEYSVRRVGPTSKSDFSRPRKTDWLVYTQAALPQ